MSLLVLVALPPALTAYNQYRLNSMTRHLAHVLNFARTQAIQIKQPVSVCPSENGEICSKDWSHGFIVYVDEGFEQVPHHILRVQHFALEYAWLTLRAFPIQEHFTFTPAGYSLQANGTFTWCIKDRSELSFCRSVTVSQTGRVRSQVA